MMWYTDASYMWNIKACHILGTHNLYCINMCLPSVVLHVTVLTLSELHLSEASLEVQFFTTLISTTTYKWGACTQHAFNITKQISSHLNKTTLIYNHFILPSFSDKITVERKIKLYWKKQDLFKKLSKLFNECRWKNTSVLLLLHW